MKVKTSITLSPAILQAIDEMVSAHSNRSRLIEQAIQEFVERRRKEAREARDLEILNQRAEELNREVEDVLRYQVRL